MLRSAPWLVAAVCALVGSGLWAYRAGLPARVSGQDAREVVRQAWTEGRRVALEGEQEIQVSGIDEPVSARVLWSRQGSMRIEYRDPPLKGVTVWEDEGRTYRFNPRLERLSVARRRGSPADTERQEKQLLENYAVSVTGRDRIADRPATVVELRSKSRGGRLKRLWIDSKTSVILGTEDVDGEHLLRSTKFTRVNYLGGRDEPAATEFRPSEELMRKYGTARPGDTSARFEPEQLSKLVGFPVRVPKELPDGFTFQGAYQTPCLCKGRHQAARLEYSDGLNTISLFECGYPECKAATKP
ncbi:MAG: sigma-E factor regulatory protein RseB domain-containing protein, partial [Actinomycetota bacterium]